MKTLIYNLFELKESKISKLFNYFIFFLIILSILSIVLESISDFVNDYKTYLEWFSFFSIFIFSIEYILRVYISDITHPSKNKFNSMLKFIFSTHGIIDLFAILPFYLPFLVKVDLRFLRILRLTKVLRIFKVNRYTNSLNLIGCVIKEKKPELLITGFITLLTIIIASFLIYYAENEAQPEKFPDILSSIWWAVATLTTVGYGDVYPITSIGKIISGFIALLGIGIIALPTGLISSGFMDKIQESKKEKTCPYCNKKLK